MFKKLSLLLVAVMLFTNLGIAAPVSAQTATEEKVLVESNFQNCKPGTYSAENQKSDGVDLRNGIVVSDSSSLSTGYTIKNGSVYEPISEADIVDDKGTKVLRLNSFLGGTKDTTIQTDKILPNSGKVKIDLELKMSYPGSFYMYHSSSTLGGARRLWRLERRSNTEVNVFLQEKIETGASFPYNAYEKFTVIMDTATAEMSFYKNGTFLKTITGKAPAKPWQLYLVQAPHNDVKPTFTYENEADKTKIATVTDPQYVYIKSLKMTTYTETAIERVTPANGSSVMTPTEATFTFNNAIKSVEAATLYSQESGATVDVKSSLVYDGKIIKVPYAFEEDKNYTITLTGASDGITSANATTTFATESWRFSNITENPVNSSPEDNNTYFINEDFTNSDDTNIVTDANRYDWYVSSKTGASIVELDGGNKVLKLVNGADFRIQDDTSKKLNNTTNLSYDVYLNKDVKQFNIDMQYNPVAMWQYGYFKPGTEENVPTIIPGEWHKVDIAISDETGSKIYVDGKFVYNTPKGANPLSVVSFFRFKPTGADVLIDNLKLYLNKGETVLTDVAPAYDATDAKASTPIEFTYNETIGDVSGAKLIVKPNDTNQATVLTNGNGMTVNVENSTVKVILDDALSANLGYAVELSGLKDISGAVVSPVRTRFSTVADDSEWIMTDVDTVSCGPLAKTYSFKLKHQGAAESAQLISATYNSNGSLSSVVLSDAKFVGESWEDFTVTAEFGPDKTTRLFIWNSVNGMVPIFDVILK